MTILLKQRAHYERMAEAAQITPSMLSVRAGQLLNEAEDSEVRIAELQRETASLLVEAAHNMRMIARVALQRTEAGK